MGNLLLLLQSYLASEFVNIPPYNFEGCRIMGNPYEIATFIQHGSTPLIVIEGGRRRSTPGPFANQLQRRANVTIRLIYAVIDPDFYRNDDDNNIYVVGDAVRQQLAANKTLGTVNDPIRYELWDIGEEDTPQSAKYLEQWIRCEYRWQEQWDGPINDQSSLIPYGSA